MIHPIFGSTPIWFAWDPLDFEKIQVMGSPVLGDEERDPRGDEERLGWMATHPGAALLQARGGQVEHLVGTFPCVSLRSIFRVEGKQQLHIFVHFLFYFFHRVVFKSWKEKSSQTFFDYSVC